MGLGTELAPATGMFRGSFAKLLSHAYWLIPVVIIAAIAIGAFI